jgi:two-component sensor histidine kinase
LLRLRAYIADYTSSIIRRAWNLNSISSNCAKTFPGCCWRGKPIARSEAAEIDIPTAFAIPLAFIVNELITNSAKYAKSNITVRLETTPVIGHSLSVSDDGPGLPEGFDPARSKGLGMKIIAALVKQIGGALHIAPGDEGHGTRFTIKFRPPLPGRRIVP